MTDTIVDLEVRRKQSDGSYKIYHPITKAKNVKTSDGKDLESHLADDTKQLGGGYIINGDFRINQRVVSGTVVLSPGQYGHDRWKAGSSGCTYTFVTSEGRTIISITAGSLIQIIEGINLQSGSYVLSWCGTSKGKIGTGSYSNSEVSANIVGGSNLNIEFNSGTLYNVKFEKNTISTPFIPRSFGEELALCQRYYEKSYPYDVRGGSINIDGTFGLYQQNIQDGFNIATVYFRVSKRISGGTVHVYSPNTGAADKVSIAGVDKNVLATASQNSLLVSQSGTGVNSGNVQFQWTVDAEL